VSEEHHNESKPHNANIDLIVDTHTTASGKAKHAVHERRNAKRFTAPHIRSTIRGVIANRQKASVARELLDDLSKHVIRNDRNCSCGSPTPSSSRKTSTSPSSPPRTCRQRRFSCASSARCARRCQSVRCSARWNASLDQFSTRAEAIRCRRLVAGAAAYRDYQQFVARATVLRKVRFCFDSSWRKILFTIAFFCFADRRQRYVACAAALDAVDSAAFGDLREKKKKTPKSTNGNTTSSPTTTTTPKKKAPVPAILKFGSAYNTQEHVASELKTASANATTRNLSLIVYDLAAALAAQADVPFDRATRLAVRRACVRVSSEGGRSRRRARGGGHRRRRRQ
jgi:hypothetical protein